MSYAPTDLLTVYLETEERRKVGRLAAVVVSNLVTRRMLSPEHRGGAIPSLNPCAINTE